MKVEYCSTYEAKSAGLQHRNSLPSDSVLLFTAIGSDQMFHMHNVRFPIIITAIDEKGKVLKKSVLKPETDTFRTPKGTAHVVEAGLNFPYEIIENESFPKLEMSEINAKLRI